MKVAVVMMLRDEIDIIEKCLSHWQSVGVENFYICDNGSVDGSDTIAKNYAAYFISDNRTNWPGREIINTLKNKALSDGCDWVFPADADEFITTLDIHQWLESYNTSFGWGEMKYLNILPSGYNYFQEPHRKVFGKLKPEWNISMGNHIIEGVEPTIDSNGVYYKHYSLRTYEQFKKKMINYMTAFNQTVFTDHPHSVDYHKYMSEGEAFLERRWFELTNV